ncbi:MAG: hypothetical protein J2P27_07220 [Actinobacteria bacterium]|nr:hypothetical protein [Actinomycetota bacterium]
MRRGDAAAHTYQDVGITAEVTTCDFCGRNLNGTVALVAYSVDGELIGNMYACDACATEGRRSGTVGIRAGRRKDPRLGGP